MYPHKFQISGEAPDADWLENVVELAFDASDIMDEYSSVGASDSEPLYMVREILREIFGEENCEDIY